MIYTFEELKAYLKNGNCIETKKVYGKTYTYYGYGESKPFCNPVFFINPETLDTDVNTVIFTYYRYNITSDIVQRFNKHKNKWVNVQPSEKTPVYISSLPGCYSDIIKYRKNYIATHPNEYNIAVYKAYNHQCQRKTDAEDQIKNIEKLAEQKGIILKKR